MALRRAAFTVRILRMSAPVIHDEVTYHGTVTRDATVRQLMEQLLRRHNHHYRLASIDYLITRAQRWRYVAVGLDGSRAKIRSTKKLVNLSVFHLALEITL